MACYHPAYIQRSVKLSTGEVSTKFLGSKLRCLETDSVLKEAYQGLKENGFHPRTYQNGFAHDFIQIPCGKCIGCRMDYSRSWADRMTYHVIGREENSFFLTLTYDDDHLETLEHSCNYDLYALNYEHIREFIKALRNKFRDCSLDFYYSGEYGDSSFRPHFHMIVYNVPREGLELEFWKLNDNGDVVYTSEVIHRLWKKGICSVSDFSWRGAAYTASYVEKKRDGRALIEYTAVGLTPEKCGCSRRPGLAHDYYMENYQDIWKNSGLSVDRTVNASGKLGIPRYFRKLAENGVGFDDFLEWQERSLERQNLLNPFKLENSSFDLNSIGRLLAFEEREILSVQKNKKL